MGAPREKILEPSWTVKAHKCVHPYSLIKAFTVYLENFEKAQISLHIADVTTIEPSLYIVEYPAEL